MKDDLLPDDEPLAETGSAVQALPDPLVPEAAPHGHLTLESIVLIGILALVWGSSFILMKRGLRLFSPVEVGALRMTAAGLVLLPLAIARRKDIRREHLPYMIASGLIGSFFPAFLFSSAGAHIDSGISGSLNGLSPLFTLLVGVAFFQTRTGPAGYLGILLGLTGALALSLVRAKEGAELNIWALPIVLATVMYAININLVKRHLHGAHPITTTAVALFLPAMLSIGVLALATPFVGRISQPGFWDVPLFSVLTLGIFGSAISIVLYNRLLKQVSALVASTVTYLMPVVALGWGLLDGESIQAWQYAGLLLVMGGLALVGASGRKKK